MIDAGKVVAEGTANQLKDRLGGDVLEARLRSASDLDHAASLIAALAHGAPRLDRDLRTVSSRRKARRTC